MSGFNPVANAAKVQRLNEKRDKELKELNRKREEAAARSAGAGLKSFGAARVTLDAAVAAQTVGLVSRDDFLATRKRLEAESEAEAAAKAEALRAGAAAKQAAEKKALAEKRRKERSALSFYEEDDDSDGSDGESDGRCDDAERADRRLNARARAGGSMRAPQGIYPRARAMPPRAARLAPRAAPRAPPPARQPGADGGTPISPSAAGRAVSLPPRACAVRVDPRVAAPIRSEDAPAPPKRARKIGKDPGASTDFLPDRDREAEAAAAREALAADWRAREDELKQNDISITYSFWDGRGHRRNISVKRGATVGDFLDAVRRQLASEGFREMKVRGCGHGGKWGREGGRRW